MQKNKISELRLDCPYVRELNCSHNLLMKISGDFPYIEKVDLSRNRLLSLDFGLFKASEELDVSGNGVLVDEAA